MKVLTRSASLLLSLILCAFLATAQQPVPAPQTPVAASNTVQLVIEGKVINVHDGDTVTVLDESNQKFNIRLHGIDAPELKQAFGSVSQKNLARLVLGKQVSVYWTKVDKYRRTVGTIRIDGRDINIEQVKAGLAWHFKKYQDEQEPEDRVTYAAAEVAARTAKLGLWEDPDPIAPGDWRAGVKEKRWGPPPPLGTIIGNSNSKRYHRPDCEGYRNMAERNRVFFKTVAEAEGAGYKRAGNCPAESQLAQSRPAANIPIASPVAAPQVVTPAATGPSIANLGVTSLPPTRPSPVSIAIGGYDAHWIFGNGQASESTDEKIAGNSNSKKYHHPDCPGYRNISEKNRVYFKTVAEAEAAGYTRAGNCPEAEQVSKIETPANASPASPVALTTPTSPAAAVAQTTKAVDEKIIGNSNSKKYHRPGCPGYKSTSEKNRVFFKTAAEAEAAGYKRAGNCPAEDESAQTEAPANIAAATLAAPPQVVTPVAATPGVATSSSTSLPPTPPSPVAATTTPETSPASTPAATTTSTSGKIIGNKNSKVYHLPGCSSYGRVSEKNQVLFDTVADAEKAGFRIAANCSAKPKE